MKDAVRRIFFLGAVVLALSFFRAAPVGAGISLPFGEIHVENVQPGRVYTASRDILNGSPLSVFNNTESPLRCVVQFYVPGPDDLREGAEPIPDVSWVTLQRESFDMPANGKGETDFYLSVPNDSALLGRKFQVQYVIQTANVGSVVRLALGGRMIFSFAKDRVEWTPQEPESHRMGVRFRLDPPAITAENVKAGRRVAFKKLLGKPWVIKNDGQYPTRVTFRVAGIEETHADPVGGSVVVSTDTKAVKLKTTSAILPPGGSVEIKGSVRVPNRSEFRGKRCFLIIAVENEDKKFPVTKYVALLIKTRP